VTTVEIELPAGFDVKACGSCSSPIVWLANLDNGRTFAAVVDPENRSRFKLHECKALQSPIVWRALSATPTAHQHEINAAGRLAVERAIQSKSSTEGDRDAEVH